MSKSIVLLLILVFFAASSVITFLPVKASSRMIVVPDDCSTISDAVANASEGDSVFVRKGTYQEQTLIINKTLSIKGETAKDTVLNFHPLLIFGGYMSFVPSYYYDNPITIYANNVELSGFTISSQETNQAPADLANHTLGRTEPPLVVSSGAGVSVSGNQAKIMGNIVNTGLSIEGYYQTIAENTLVRGLKCHGSNNKIISNTVTGSGIEVGGFYNQVYANSIVGEYKIHSGILSTGNGNIIAQNNVTNCNGGLVIYKSNNGGSSNNLFYANRLIKNVYGIDVSSGNNNTFYANELINNTVGAKVGYLEPPETQAVFYHNNFVGSIEQVGLSNSVTYIPGVWSEPFNVTGYFDNGREGNYWSDYSGSDNNGDGIGDAPYIIDATRRDSYPLMARFDISTATLVLPISSPEQSQLESFPIATVVAAIATTIALVALGIIIYSKKRNKRPTG